MVVTLLGTLVALAAAVVLFGRLLAAALDARLLRRFTPINAAASAIVGTAAIVVVFGWLTMSGWPAPRIVGALGVAAASLFLASIGRGTLDALRPSGSARSWLALLLPMLLAVGLSLLPLAASGDLNVCNDTFIYSALGQWLQWNGLSAAHAAEVSSVMEGLPQFYGGSVRIGAVYLLATVQAATRSSLSLFVFPAVASWSVLVLMSAIAVCLRWVFRFPLRWIGGSLLVFAILPHSAYWAHHNGFFSQPYGLAALLFGVALATRVTAARERTVSAAILIGLVAAFLMSAYVPVLPAFGAAWAYTGALILWRAHRRRRLTAALRFCVIALLSFALWGFRDGVALLRGLRMLATITVGWHIPLHGVSELAFTMGTLSLYSRVVPALEGGALVLAWIAAFVAAGLAGAGVLRAAVAPRTRPLIVVLLLFVASFIYYRAGVRDPWSQEIGHTWSVFKLAQWVYPTLFLLQCAAVRRARLYAPPAVPWSAMLIAAALGLQHQVWLRPGWGSLDRIVQAPRHRARAGAPVAADASGPSRFARLREMQAALRGLPEGTLYLVGRSDDRAVWLGPYLALLAYPRPFLADWDRAALGLHQETARAVPGGVSPPVRKVILIACRPSEVAAEVVRDLGWECGILAADRPVVVEIGGRRQLRSSGGALRIMIWTPADTRGELVLDLQSSGPTPALSVFQEGQRVAQIASGPAGERRLPLFLRSGLTPVDLRLEGGGVAPNVTGARYEASP